MAPNAAARDELRRDEVDRDDQAGSRERRALDAVEADAARPEHGDAVTFGHLARVDDRSVAGDDAAGQQARAVERQLGPDAHRLRVMHDGLLGEAAGAEALVDLGTCARAQGAALVEREARAAERRLPAQAGAALAAGAHERDHDAVARHEPSRS